MQQEHAVVKAWAGWAVSFDVWAGKTRCYIKA